MKKYLFVLGLFMLVGLSSCHTHGKTNILLERTFPTMSWERFDFINKEVTIEKPVTYDLVLKVTLDPTYGFDYLSVVFSIFDSGDHPFRTKGYQFKLKERDGSWKSELVDGAYHFTLPINSELSLNEPGTYKFELENRMPITPLLGIQEIAIINNKR